MILMSGSQGRQDVLHVVGYLGKEPVAAGRVVLKMPGYDYPKIGRIAVLKSVRGQGLGVKSWNAFTA